MKPLTIQFVTSPEGSGHFLGAEILHGDELIVEVRENAGSLDVVAYCGKRVAWQVPARVFSNLLVQSIEELSALRDTGSETS